MNLSEDELNVFTEKYKVRNIWLEGQEIVNSKSPVWLEIKLWRPKFLNWLPVGNQSCFPKRFHILKKIDLFR